jgi:hypothetical protein
MSFLIRLWREAEAETGSLPADWHCEVEHIQTGQRWRFDTLNELLEFLHRQAASPHARQSEER